MNEKMVSPLHGKSRYSGMREKRVMFAGCIGAAGYAAIVIRLFSLQCIHGREMRVRAEEVCSRRIELASHRGNILDCKGRPLAVNLYCGTAGFDPGVIRPDVSGAQSAQQRMQRISSALTQTASLLHVSTQHLQTIVQNALSSEPRTHSRWVPVCSGLTMQQAAALKQLHPFGFGVEDGMERLYPDGMDAAQVIGFLGPNGNGQAGLEWGCNKWLTGHNGFARVEADANNREIPGTLQALKPARDGMTVCTTLDADAQRIATAAAKKIMAEFHPKGVSITIVSPSTGDIKAMVSLPAFNANPIAGSGGKRPPIALQSMQDRCAGSIYEPGSTIKAFTLSYALDRDFIAPGTTFYCSGRFPIGRHAIHCAKGEIHGVVNAAKILRVSCNIGAAQVGLRMGGRNLQEAFTTFGLFSTPSLPLPGVERGHWSFDFSAMRYSAAKTARAAFGQAVTTTPLALAMGYAALANKGVLMQPRLVTDLQQGGTVVRNFPPVQVRRAVSADTAQEVMQMLEGVVTNGTGTSAALPGYTVAGKTGTASLYRPGAYTGSFIGIVPASAPRVVILVTVRDPEPPHYYGAEVAAPAFQSIAAQLMAIWHVPQDDPNNLQYDAAQAGARAQMGLPPLPENKTQTISLH